MYKKMIEDAQAKGLGSEKVMWQSVGEIDEILCMMKKEHPEMYWKFVRKQHGLLYNNHYTEDFAKWDVEHMKPVGAYWTVVQIEDATKGFSFPAGTTLWDKYVAFHAFKNDLNGVLPDDQIIKAAYAFWFNDKDWKPEGGKIWAYMCMNV